MSARTPDEVLAKALTDLPEGAYLTSAIVIVEYQLPAEDDDLQRGPWLSWRADSVVGRWTHLGMLESVVGDVRRQLSQED
jgi:hypothetical protein